LSDGIAGAFERALLNYEEKLGPGAPFVARYSDNHDEGRGFYLYGPGATKAINQLVFLAPRTLPFILTGEEFGAVNRPPIHDRMNPIGKRRRIVNGDHVREQESVEFEGNSFARDPAERAALYRSSRPSSNCAETIRELSEGSFHLINADEDAPRAQRSVIAFERRLGNQTLRCAVNLGPQPRVLKQAKAFRGKALFGQLVQGTLPAFSSIVVQLKTPARL
jgi:glycosidase